MACKAKILIMQKAANAKTKLNYRMEQLIMIIKNDKLMANIDKQITKLERKFKEVNSYNNQSKFIGLMEIHSSIDTMRNIFSCISDFNKYESKLIKLYNNVQIEQNKILGNPLDYFLLHEKEGATV